MVLQSDSEQHLHRSTLHIPVRLRVWLWQYGCGSFNRKEIFLEVVRAPVALCASAGGAAKLGDAKLDDLCAFIASQSGAGLMCALHPVTNGRYRRATCNVVQDANAQRIHYAQILHQA